MRSVQLDSLCRASARVVAKLARRALARQLRHATSCRRRSTSRALRFNAARKRSVSPKPAAEDYQGNQGKPHNQHA
ncbi:MAG TPA: hypothetical protein VFN13_01280, partial [Rudaea sp.]|nr:hypothetical protein [Rudaea sp.]